MAVHYYQPDQRFCACGVPWMYQKHTGDAEAVTCGNCVRALASSVSKALRPAVDTGRLKVSYVNAKIRLLVKP